MSLRTLARLPLWRRRYRIPRRRHESASAATRQEAGRPLLHGVKDTVELRADKADGS